MLEEILKSINSNLERIAISLEENNKLLKEPINFSGPEFLNAMSALEENTMQQPNTTAISQAQQPNTAVIPQAPTPVVQPVQNQESVQTPQSTSVPITQVQESFTQEQLAVAMSNAVSAGKMNIIQNILQQFGVQALTQINPADYNKLATMLKEAGVNV